MRLAARFACLAALAVWLCAGCSSVGTRRTDVPLPSEATFEQALLRYVRGELPMAREALLVALREDPGDLRARELLDAVEREMGGEATELAPPTLPEGPMSPEAILRAVRERNHDVRQALQRVIGERAQLREANWDFTPEFQVVSRIDPLSWVLTSSQNLLVTILQRGARMQAAEADMIAEVAGYARARADAAAEAMRNYLFLLDAQEQIQAFDEEIVAREEQVRVARVLERYGSVLRDDVLEREAALATARERRSERIGQEVVARANLNRLMALPAEEPLAVSRMWPADPLPRDMVGAVEAARRRRPEIRFAKLRVEEAAAGAERIHADDYRIEPRTSWQPFPNPQNTGEEGGRKFSSSLRLAFPLFLLPIEDARTDRETAVVRELQLEVEKVSGQVSVEAVSAWQEVLKGRRGVAAARRQIDAAEAALSVQSTVDRWGASADLLTLLDARAKLAEAKGRAASFAYDFDRAVVALRRAMGEPPDGLRFATGQGPRAAQIPGEDGPVAAHGRAMWVWGRDLLERPGEADFLLDFAETRGVGTLFLSASTTRIERTPDPYRAFLARAHARGLRVEAVSGEAGWVLPGGRRHAAAFLTAVRAFNEREEAASRFDGVHLDVEPHTLDAWKGERQAALAEAYVSLIGWSAERAREAGLPLAADVPVGYDAVPYQGGTLIEAVLERVDAIGVMAYGHGAGALTRAVQGEMEAAEGAGKRAWVGLSADADDLPKAGVGQPLDGPLESLAEEAVLAYRNWPSFAGVAVHDYARYRALILGREPR